jgi:hypothetical protein
MSRRTKRTHRPVGASWDEFDGSSASRPARAAPRRNEAKDPPGGRARNEPNGPLEQVRMTLTDYDVSPGQSRAAAKRSQARRRKGLGLDPAGAGPRQAPAPFPKKDPPASWADGADRRIHEPPNETNPTAKCVDWADCKEGLVAERNEPNGILEQGGKLCRITLHPAAGAAPRPRPHPPRPGPCAEQTAGQFPRIFLSQNILRGAGPPRSRFKRTHREPPDRASCSVSRIPTTVSRTAVTVLGEEVEKRTGLRWEVRGEPPDPGAVTWLRSWAKPSRRRCGAGQPA